MGDGGSQTRETPDQELYQLYYSFAVWTSLFHRLSICRLNLLPLFHLFSLVRLEIEKEKGDVLEFQNLETRTFGTCRFSRPCPTHFDVYMFVSVFLTEHWELLTTLCFAGERSSRHWEVCAFWQEEIWNWISRSSLASLSRSSLFSLIIALFTSQLVSDFS